MKRTSKQLKTSRRNLSLMILAGIATNLNRMKSYSKSTIVQLRISIIIEHVEKLQREIQDTTYESWEA